MDLEPKPVVRSITSWYDSALIIDETVYGDTYPNRRQDVSTYCLLYNYMDSTVNSHVSGLINTSGFATNWTANIDQPRGVGAGLYEVILIMGLKTTWPDLNTFTPDEMYTEWLGAAEGELLAGFFPLLIIPNEYMEIINARQEYCDGIINALPLQCDYPRIRGLMTQLDYAAQLRDWDTALIAYQNLKNQFV